MTQPHSAAVRLWLIIDDRCIKLGSIGPDAVTLLQGAHNERCQPCSGVVLMTVDGEPMTWVVDLPDGVTGDTVRIVRRGKMGRAADHVPDVSKMVDSRPPLRQNDRVSSKPLR